MEQDNLIGKELEQDEIDIINEYKDKQLLHPDFPPFTTYDMVQSGYPYPNHGEMIARNWGGTDEQNKLLPPNGMWCKITQVQEYIKNLVELTKLQAKLELYEIFDKDIEQILNAETNFEDLTEEIYLNKLALENQIDELRTKMYYIL